jgi:hypothetical protein
MISTLTRHLFPVILCILLASCDALVGPDPENTPESNFEIFWKEFDRDYALFLYKGINWDSLYSVYRPQVTRTTSGRELFSILSSLLANLKDGHTSLHSPYGDYFYTELRDASPGNFNLKDVQTRYLKNQFTNGSYLCGTVGDSLAYIFISSFGDGSYGALDEILTRFHSSKGLVLDVRDNSGGDAGNADFILQRFVETRTLVAYVQDRSGPKHSDLTDLIPVYVDPAGVRFTRPVAILTNRQSASASEWFTSGFKILPRTITVGDTTAGGASSPIFRELPNGWSYRIPREIFFSPIRQTVEGIGIAPDFPVWISKADSLAGRDPILERAIDLLSR